jgi:hypothetical protein
MGCPTEVVIGDNLVFSICTHDPDTGVLTDADAVPEYRVYENITEIAILTGNMDSGSGAGHNEFDDANTVGFYVKSIACTAANGFENGKTYTIYIEATVDGDTGGISYSFKAVTQKWDLASALTLDFGTLIERIYQLLQNKEIIVDATGTSALRTIGDGADLATWSITDDDTTTIRTEATW